MTYTDTGKVSPETQSAIEQEVRTLLRVRFSLSLCSDAFILRGADHQLDYSVW